MVMRTLKWGPLKLAMRTVGRTSEGLDTGFRQGFDSGPMLDYVYRNEANGKTPIGKLFDRMFLNSVGWRGIRARKVILQSKLRAEIERFISAKKPLVIADVASGPGRYLLELVDEFRNVDDIRPDVKVICRDLDEEGLQQGREQADSMGLSDVVRYETGDACDAESLANLSPRPDVVVTSGLYELFIDPYPIHRSMQGIHSLLPDGGKFFFTSQITHPQLELIENVLVNREGVPWKMICRSVDEVEKMAADIGYTVEGTELEQIGLFSVTECSKAD